MEQLAALLVGKPINILVIAFPFLLAAWWPTAAVATPPPSRRAIRIAALAWLAYAAWEMVVAWRTPEANIRVDLLVIWPVLALLSLWAIWRWIAFLRVVRR